MRDGLCSVVASRTAILASLAAIAALVACRDAGAATASCAQYPIPWQPPAGSQAAAQSEISTMSPGAALTWSPGEGTLSSVIQLDAPLTGCSDGQDVNAQVAGVLAAHPALFQLDVSEWQLPAFYDCARVLLTGERTLRVIVNPANYSAALLSSDARCPVSDGDGSQFTVGFDLVLDVHTGAILSVKPGLDCTVC